MKTKDKIKAHGSYDSSGRQEIRNEELKESQIAIRRIVYRSNDDEEYLYED